MEQLFTVTVSTDHIHTIIQHVQTDYFSLIIRKLDDHILILEWEEVMENYQIQWHEIKAVRKALQNYSDNNGPVAILVKTFEGIVISPEIQKRLQDAKIYTDVIAVAIELKSTTHRISLNLSAQFSKNRTAIRAFATEDNAYKWLVKKQLKEA